VRALQYVERGRAEVVELPVPEIADDEVLVAARSVGVCHSDIDLLEGRYIIPFAYPLIPGHEWSGEVAAVGPKVTEFAPGDRVVGECVIGEDHFGFSISGADVIVEASGRPAVMAQALELVAFQGRIAYIGIDVGQESPAKLGLIQSKELRITGTIGSPGVWPQTLRFLAGSGIDLSPLVTQRFGVDDAVAALETAHHPSPTTIKAHVEFDARL
jgi:threonine dehydrogenase-like Zn-dependent dehydrogenase